ncbi:hypothetical protein HF329_00825 [Chitinophaga oryzae]|uniref:Uncharacterized protein n=1 Tax=Chitinophaga oryzae TaxID=2725414 RepID=A0AAE6ZE30_9BACT|nr:hypothetical protein [Chitinophaga oryzae]QJB29927.1 hypothetical protein HF329_00825 [Chitinophaga oryzae]
MLWKREYKKDTSPQENQEETYKLLDRLFERWRRLIRQFCGEIERRFNKIGLLYQKVILVGFFLSGTTLCIFLAVGDGYVKKGSLQVTPITQPAHVLPRHDTLDIFWSKKKYSPSDNIQHYRAFLDSLSSTANGKVTLDSLRRSRPGLLDSLALIGL